MPRSHVWQSKRLPYVSFCRVLLEPPVLVGPREVPPRPQQTVVRRVTAVLLLQAAIFITDSKGIKASLKWLFDWMLELGIDPKGLLVN